MAEQAEGSTSEKNPENRRRRSGVRIYELKDSTISRLVAGDGNLQALYDVCAIHVVLFAILKVLLDSLSAGRFHVDLHLFYLAIGYCSFEGIAAFILTEVVLVAVAASVHPALTAWKTIRTWFPSLLVDIAFLLIYVLGLVFSFVLSLWVVFTVPLGSAFCFTISVEQLRLSMKTYSFVRETAKKVLIPWNKDDTTGPAFQYAGQMEPKVGSMANYLYFLFAPTFLYRDRYPRSKGPIQWKNVIAYLSQFIAVLLVITVIYQDVVVPPSLSRTHVLTSLLYSCVSGFVILMLANVMILHAWLNLHAELLRFADRQFHSDWWNATSYADFYRKWNIIVHDWIHAYVYMDIKNVLSPYGFGSAVPALLTIIVSAVIHEYLMAVGLGFFFPLVSLLFGGIGAVLYVVGPCVMRRASNIFIVSSVGVGMGLLVFCYMLEFASRHYFCPREHQFSDFFFTSRFLQCYWEFN